MYNSFSTFTMLCNYRACVLSRFSRVRLFVTPWTAALQAPLSIGFPRQEYWSGLPFAIPGDHPHPRIEPKSPVSLALAGRFSTTEAPRIQLRVTLSFHLSWLPSIAFTGYSETLGQSCKLREPQFPHQKNGRDYNLYLAGVLGDALCERVG